MQSVIDWLSRYLPGLQAASPLDLTVLGLNALLLIFARRLLVLFHFDKDGEQRFLLRLRVLRLLSVLLFAVYGHLFMAGTVRPGDWHYKLLMALAVVYTGYLVDFVVHYVIKRRFGKVRQIDDDKELIETYNSRLLAILARVFISIIVLLTVIRTLGYDSLLEAGGIIGFIGVFLALTQRSWAPDIFGGLIILNSGMFEEGDVVELPGLEDRVCQVFKTKMFHTELLSLQYNYRIMVRNAMLRDYVVHNLSRFASAKGLREQLHFKIAYGSEPAAVRAMFEAAFKRAAELDLAVEQQHPMEAVILAAGDYAVDWAVFYYTKDIRHVLRTRQRLLELVVIAAEEHSIQLATPVLNDVRVEHEARAGSEQALN